jgi:hypothetical protein
MTIWFGDKGSPMLMRGTFIEDCNSGSGSWQWPEGDGKTGGYEFTMTRIG